VKDDEGLIFNFEFCIMDEVRAMLDVGFWMLVKCKNGKSIRFFGDGDC